jgi:hypothetical protein
MGETCSTHDVRGEMPTKMLLRKPEGKRPLEDIGVDRKIILEWILDK